MPTFHVHYLRALGAADWSPEGHSVTVGPNGSGKTTLLLALKLLRTAFDRTLPEAISAVLGGSYQLRNRYVSDLESVRLGVSLGDLHWAVELVPQGASVSATAHEYLRRGNEILFVRDNLGKLQVGGRPVDVAGRPQLALRILHDSTEYRLPEVLEIASLLRNIVVFHDLNYHDLKRNGSRASEDRHLASRGGNTFTILRKWLQTREHRNRFEFVKAGVLAAFPELCADFDFESAAHTVTVRVYPPRSEEARLVDAEANGLVSMLASLCAIASGDAGGIVAIDEPEVALHPFAIRELCRRAEQWSSHTGCAVVFATHSPVVLDEFNGKPHRVYCMGEGAPFVPRPANELRDPGWLSRFMLGELYVQGELGDNVSAPERPCGSKGPQGSK